MSSYVVAPARDLPPGSRRVISIGGRSVVILNVDGTFRALRNQCPHQGAPLSEGTVVGGIDAAVPGEYEYDSEHKLLKCPWHGWEFDLASGQSWFDPVHERVKSYPVSVRRGVALSGRDPGPYIAETFKVRVDDEYVVIEMP